jgi:hypothetical protein
MSFDAVGGFVVTESVGIGTGITSIFNRLRINDD